MHRAVGEAPSLALLIPSRERGGAEDYAATIARAAVRRGWRVDAALPDASGVASLRRELARSGANVRTLSIGALHGPGSRRAAARILGDLGRTAAFLACLRPDVALIMLPVPESSLGALLGATALRVPALVVFQLVPPDLAVTPRRRRLYDLARRRQRWVAISDANRDTLARAFAVDARRLVRIYNGVPVSGPPSAAVRREARAAIGAELGLDSRAKLVLTVGRLSHQKGHDAVLEALPMVIARVPDAVFLWAGDGELEGALRRRIDELGAQRHVRMLGRRRDIARLLAAADLFLFPSRYEGFGFALAEAMAAELPIVTSDRGAMRELVDDGRCGLLFRFGDPRDLAGRIAWALEHPAEMATLARAASARAAERFDEREMVDTTLRQLAALADHGDRAGRRP